MAAAAERHRADGRERSWSRLRNPASNKADLALRQCILYHLIHCRAPRRGCILANLETRPAMCRDLPGDPMQRRKHAFIYCTISEFHALSLMQ